jgi:hypothetical protein
MGFSDIDLSESDNERISKELQGWPEEALAQAAQDPNGQVPQILAMIELERRSESPVQAPDSTVLQDLLAETQGMQQQGAPQLPPGMGGPAGGLGTMAPPGMPQMSQGPPGMPPGMPPGSGLSSGMPPQGPPGMAAGGLIRGFQDGSRGEPVYASNPGVMGSARMKPGYNVSKREEIKRQIKKLVELSKRVDPSKRGMIDSKIESLESSLGEFDDPEARRTGRSGLIRSGGVRPGVGGDIERASGISNEMLERIDLEDPSGAAASLINQRRSDAERLYELGIGPDPSPPDGRGIGVIAPNELAQIESGELPPDIAMHRQGAGWMDRLVDPPASASGEVPPMFFGPGGERVGHTGPPVPEQDIELSLLDKLAAVRGPQAGGQQAGGQQAGGEIDINSVLAGDNIGAVRNDVLGLQGGNSAQLNWNEQIKKRLDEIASRNAGMSDNERNLLIASHFLDAQSFGKGAAAAAGAVAEANKESRAAQTVQDLSLLGVEANLASQQDLRTYREADLNQRKNEANQSARLAVEKANQLYDLENSKLSETQIQNKERIILEGANFEQRAAIASVQDGIARDKLKLENFIAKHNVELSKRKVLIDSYTDFMKSYDIAARATEVLEGNLGTKESEERREQYSLMILNKLSGQVGIGSTVRNRGPVRQP